MVLSWVAIQSKNQYNFSLITMHVIMSAIWRVNNHFNTWFLTDFQGVCTGDHKKKDNSSLTICTQIIAPNVT